MILTSPRFSGATPAMACFMVLSEMNRSRMRQWKVHQRNKKWRAGRVPRPNAGREEKQSFTRRREAREEDLEKRKSAVPPTFEYSYSFAFFAPSRAIFLHFPVRRRRCAHEKTRPSWLT